MATRILLKVGWGCVSRKSSGLNVRVLEPELLQHTDLFGYDYAHWAASIALGKLAADGEVSAANLMPMTCSGIV